MSQYSEGASCIVEEVNVATSLQEAMKIYGSHSSLEAHVTELENELKDVKERYNVASAFVEEKAH